MQTIIESSSSATKEEFLAWMLVAHPDLYVCSYNQLKQIAVDQFMVQLEKYQPPGVVFSFLLAVLLHFGEYVQSFLSSPMNWLKSIFLWGPSQTRKTMWAQSHRDHIYWSNMIDLSLWNDGAKYIVLDDINWDYLPAKKFL